MDFYGCARGDGGKFSAILVGCDSVLFAGEGIGVDLLSDFKRESLEETGWLRGNGLSP